MLGTLHKWKENPCSTIDTLIGVKAEFNGDIVFSGGLRIDGVVKGDITAQGEHNSLLILGEHAEVHGHVTVPHLISNGKIRGLVHCATRMELEPQAEIVGDVHYKILIIAKGATIHGNLALQTSDNSKYGPVTKPKLVAAPGERAP